MNVEGNGDPKRMPVVSRVARWRPRFWLVALGLVAIGEAFVLVQFVEELQAYQAYPCHGEECFVPAMRVTYWGAIMFIWPVAGVISAGIVKLIGLFVLWVWDRLTSGADSHRL